MDISKVKAELWTLLKSFLGAVLAAAGLAALQWIGVHLPDAINFFTTIASAYGAQHIGS